TTQTYPTLVNFDALSAEFSLPSRPPTVSSVSPMNGSGASQTFSFIFSDADGYTDLNIVYGLFNSTLSTANACFFAYSRVDGHLYLFNDAGGGLVPGSLTPGGAGSLTNSQCTLDGPGSSVSGAGNTLTVNAALTFKPAFTGAKNIYMLAI